MLNKLTVRTAMPKGSARPSARGKSARRGQASWQTRMVHTADRLTFNWGIRRALYRHLATQISNGITTEKALEGFRVRLQRRKKVTPDKIVADIARKMRDGSSLSNAMVNWIPLDESSIISSGELAGNVHKALELLIEAKQRSARIMRAMVSAMFTPIVYTFALYAVMFVLGRYALPDLIGGQPSSSLHGSLGILAAVGDFANSWYAMLPLVAAAALIWATIHSLSRWTGKYRIKAERFFPYSFYRDVQGYTWLMSFTALLRAGMTDVLILKRQQQFASPWLKERLRALHWRMDNGASLPDALLAKGKNGMPPFEFPNPEIIDDIASMAGFSDFPERISKVVADWSSEQEEQMLSRSKLYGLMVEVFMYLVMGLFMMAINNLGTTMSMPHP